MTCWPNGTKAKPYETSAFGPRRAPTAGASTYHRGADLVGFARIRAVASGRVVVAGTPRGWAAGGTQVWIQHDGFFTRSLHMRAGSLAVRVGDVVEEGADLGAMGRTGTATDVHLHFELTPGNVHYANTGQIDPVAFISNRLSAAAGGGTFTPVPEEDEDMKIIRWAANGACWLMGDESTDYIATGKELATLEAIFGPSKTVENDALTTVVASLKVPWAAMEATYRGGAFDNESRFGRGTSWTRTMAEADREAKFDASLAASIEQLQKAIGAGTTAAAG